jgi:uncharacterized protein (UPF0335 family)
MLKMLPAAPFTYAQYQAAGWTDEQLIDAKLAERETSFQVVATDDRLRLLIERVERLDEERKGISDDIRDVYAEAKAVGYDAKIMREIVKLRRMKPDDRAEMEAILETYKCALGLG